MGAVSSVYTRPLQHHEPLLTNENLAENSFQAVTIVQPDICNETPEQKILRLEKTLAFEREEKWAAIAQSERRRVQLINYKKGVLVKESEFYGEDDDDVEERKDDLTAEDSAGNEEDPDEDLKSFQTRMQQFREARLKAVTDKSKELNELRDAVKIEKELREIAEMKLASVVLSAHTVHDEKISMHLIEQNIILHKRIEKLRNDIEAENLARKYDECLRNEIDQLKREVCSLKGKTEKQQIEIGNLKKINERLTRDYEFSKKEKERLENKLTDVDEEQKKAWESYDKEKVEIARRTNALKEVIAVSREMLAIRDQQVTDLKAKLSDIEKSIEEKNRLEGGPLKVEYEKQLENIRVLKELYAERMELMEAEKRNLVEQTSQDGKKIENLNNELSDLTIKYEIAAEEVDSEKQKNLELTAEGCALAAEARGCQRELTAMNQMLTRMLLGRSPAELDRLGELLQQNHGLIARIATSEPYNDVAASLPKLLLDLIAQVDEKENSVQSIELDKFDLSDQMTDSTDTLSGHSEGLAIVSYKNAVVFRSNHNKVEVVAEETTAQPTHHYQPPADMDPVVQEIVNNLPKVWKVLTELLSQQTPVEIPAANEDRTCYKCIDTPQGPKNVISVSKTFLKLKDLILEKKSLTHEVCRLKHLNTHLETRLDEQEKRLSTVQCELHKTWGVVGKMRAQHQQLHNQEKILRYELQEKRLMLGELKEELEICRDKWQKARQKNLISEAECTKLRQEFAARKLLRNARDSGESGYSDGANSSDTDRSSSSSPVLFTPEKKENVEKNENETASPENLDKSTTDGKLVAENSGNSIEIETQIPSTSRLKNEKVEIVSDEAEKTAEGNRSREARLSRLEEQCQLLVRKVEITTHKSHYLSNRLEELHDHYSGPGEASGGTSVAQRREEKSNMNQKTDVENVAENVESNDRISLSEETAGELKEKNEVLERVTSNAENIQEDHGSSVNEEEGARCLESLIENPKDEIQVLKEKDCTEGKIVTEKTDKIRENSSSLESRMDARAARLKRLEEESMKLLNKTRNTIQRSDNLSEKLEVLHNEYSRPEDASNLVEVTEKVVDPNSESNQQPLSETQNEQTQIDLSTTDHSLPESEQTIYMSSQEDQGLSENHEGVSKCTEILDKPGENKSENYSKESEHQSNNVLQKTTTLSKELQCAETPIENISWEAPADYTLLQADQSSSYTLLNEAVLPETLLQNLTENLPLTAPEHSNHFDQILSECDQVENVVKTDEDVPKRLQGESPSTETITKSGQASLTSLQNGEILSVRLQGVPEPAEKPAESSAEGSVGSQTDLKTNKPEMSAADRAQAREDRLRRLEEESRLLLRRTRNTLERGNTMSDRLQTLHDQNESLENGCPSDVDETSNKS